MQHSFLQRVFLTILAGFATAGLVYFYRHVVEQARYEMNEGFNDSHKKAAHH
jgi:hypothetical protein